VFTAAQAVRFGITRNALSNAVSSGRLERIARGAYRMSGVPASQSDELLAVWKLTDPAAYSHERVSVWDGIAVGGSTASRLLGMGDFFLSPYRIYTRRRFNSRLRMALFTVRAIDAEDPSLVEGALADALRSGSRPFDVGRLERLVGDNSRRMAPQVAARLLSLANSPRRGSRP
jgi:hypothetical protein